MAVNWVTGSEAAVTVTLFELEQLLLGYSGKDIQKMHGEIQPPKWQLC